eukprot:m.134740 g.134740  ORF g.134740 m.134740 type:complete len:480 (-) comp9873_c2_seq1:222-1661(-)
MEPPAPPVAALQALLAASAAANADGQGASPAGGASTLLRVSSLLAGSPASSDEIASFLATEAAILGGDEGHNSQSEAPVTSSWLAAVAAALDTHPAAPSTVFWPRSSFLPGAAIPKTPLAVATYVAALAEQCGLGSSLRVCASLDCVWFECDEASAARRKTILLVPDPTTGCIDLEPISESERRQLRFKSTRCASPELSAIGLAGVLLEEYLCSRIDCGLGSAPSLDLLPLFGLAAIEDLALHASSEWLRLLGIVLRAFPTHDCARAVLDSISTTRTALVTAGAAESAFSGRLGALVSRELDAVQQRLAMAHGTHSSCSSSASSSEAPHSYDFGMLLALHILQCGVALCHPNYKCHLLLATTSNEMDKYFDALAEIQATLLTLEPGTDEFLTGSSAGASARQIARLMRRQLEEARDARRPRLPQTPVKARRVVLPDLDDMDMPRQKKMRLKRNIFADPFRHKERDGPPSPPNLGGSPTA